MTNTTLPWLDLPVSTGLDENKIIDPRDRAVACGNNTGNLLFRLGLERFLERHFNISLKPMQWSDIVNTKPSAPVVLSCANWLAAEGDAFDIYCENRTNNFNRAGIAQAIFVGLGCNSITSSPSEFKLGRGSLQLAQLASQRSRYILVRDKFTEQVLKYHGLENAVACGCPSNQITDFSINKAARARLLAKTIRASKMKSLDDCRFVMTQLEYHKPSKVLLKLFAEYSISENFTYVFQGTSADQLNFSGILDKHLEDLSNACKELNDRCMISLLDKNPSLFRTFYDSREWLGFLSGQQLSIGPRIHGAMASIQGCTPALLCAHDQRTHGLAHEMGIPLWSENNTSIIESLHKLEEGYNLYLDKQASQKALLINLLGETIKT